MTRNELCIYLWSFKWKYIKPHGVWGIWKDSTRNIRLVGLYAHVFIHEAWRAHASQVNIWTLWMYNICPVQNPWWFWVLYHGWRLANAINYRIKFYICMQLYSYNIYIRTQLYIRLYILYIIYNYVLYLRETWRRWEFPDSPNVSFIEWTKL